jgi:hypothetical protein
MLSLSNTDHSGTWQYQALLSFPAYDVVAQLASTQCTEGISRSISQINPDILVCDNDFIEYPHPDKHFNKRHDSRKPLIFVDYQNSTGSLKRNVQKPEDKHEYNGGP